MPHMLSRHGLHLTDQHYLMDSHPLIESTLVLLHGSQNLYNPLLSAISCVIVYEA
jgi:hypothetical protein